MQKEKNIVGKVGFLDFAKYHGRKQVGSSDIRCHWLINNLENSEQFKCGQKYDAVIYQKAYFAEHARIFNGIKILDLCDPDYLHWGYKIKETIDEVDAITTSTESLANGLRKFTNKPVLCIPDRIDLNLHKEKKVHIGNAKKVVWFGYNTNFSMLDSSLQCLYDNGLDLIVISNKEYKLPYIYESKIDIENVKYDVETVNSALLRGDFVINPQSANGKWKFKSNNKTIKAWSLGLPVAHNPEEVRSFILEEARISESNKRLKEVIEKWDVKISVKELQDLILKLKDNKLS